MSKILLTGGHLTPALAVIDYLRAAHPEVELVFAGREYAQLATKQPSWEKQEITARGLKFIPFTAQKTGHFNPLTFGETITQARTILTAETVTHVLSFGGYLALPFALAATRLHLPLVTHEQTRVLGRTNRLLALLADRTAVSFPDTQTPWYIAPKKLTVTGNPLREQLFDTQANRPEWFRPQANLPILYISGGSQGAQALNDLVLPILAPLTQDYIVIHQVGRRSRDLDPLAKVRTYVADNYLQLTNYFPREFIQVEELAYFYPRLQLAVARAGANTVAELTAFRVPTLYLPLPQANYHEQEKNAAALVAAHAALLLPQTGARPSDLLADINELAKGQDALRAQLHTLPTERDASAHIYQLLSSITKTPTTARPRLNLEQFQLPPLPKPKPNRAPSRLASSPEDDPPRTSTTTSKANDTATVTIESLDEILR